MRTRERALLQQMWARSERDRLVARSTCNRFLSALMRAVRCIRAHSPSHVHYQPGNDVTGSRQTRSAAAITKVRHRHGRKRTGCANMVAALPTRWRSRQRAAASTGTTPRRRRPWTAHGTRAPAALRWRSATCAAARCVSQPTICADSAFMCVNVALGLRSRW